MLEEEERAPNSAGPCSAGAARVDDEDEIASVAARNKDELEEIFMTG